MNTNLLGDKTPKEGSQCICLSVIMIYSNLRIDKIYCPQVFFEECEYAVKEMIRCQRNA